MAGLLSTFAAFEHEILRERVRAGLTHARENGKRLNRPATAAAKSSEIRRNPVMDTCGRCWFSVHTIGWDGADRIVRCAGGG